MDVRVATEQEPPPVPAAAPSAWRAEAPAGEEDAWRIGSITSSSAGTQWLW